MKRVRKASRVEPLAQDRRVRILTFGGAFGCLLGLSLLKFGNPIILDRLIEPPTDVWEYIFQPWPVRWGYVALLACLGVLVGFVRRSPELPVPKYFLVALGGWFGWQWVAALQTVDSAITRSTLMHFAACVGCFLGGLLGLARLKDSRIFWIPILLAFAFVLWTGFEQHYGGLEATRKMFFDQPNWREYSPDYIKKIQSDRIFSTLVYPNALAGAILLLLPSTLLTLWMATARWRHLARSILFGLLAYGAFACLLWSGSKSGWLIALVLVLAFLLRQPLPKRLKLGVVISVVAIGLAGFSVKYAGYFGRGAPSVSARFEYWKAALRTAMDNPVTGTGPGTFSVAYRKIKPPEAEMAQLTHNDYLEQASDSGVVGFLFYTSFILGSIAVLPRYGAIFRQDEAFAIWLGLLGWCLQSFVEFPLYIPALAWTAFALFGWLWGRAGNNKELDSGSAGC